MAPDNTPRPAKTELVHALSFLAVAGCVVGYLSFAWPTIGDPDSLYHFAHGLIYSDRGPFDQTFPWTAVSATGTHHADLWWGVHMFASMFAGVRDHVVGLRIATLAWTALSLVGLYFASRRLNLVFAWCVPFLWLFSGALETGRIVALRPQNASAALFVGMTALIIRGASIWALVAVGWATSLFHQTLSWMAVPVALVAGIAACIAEKRSSPLIRSVWVVAGVCAGWILRPGALDAVALMRIQILDLAKARADGIDLPFGTEVTRLTTSELSHYFLLFTVLWLVSLLVGAYVAYKDRATVERGVTTAFGACAALSLGFYDLTLTSSTRGLEYWTVFGAVTICLAATLVISRRARPLQLAWAGATAVPILLACIAFGPLGEFMRIQAIYPNRMQAPMNFLAKSSNQGDLVWNAHWEFFGEMLFWDRRNVYVQGMDPIFLYAQNPDLCQIVDVCRADRWGAVDAGGHPLLGAEFGNPPDLFKALRGRFAASWALVLPSATPHLAATMSADSRFTLLYDDGVVQIFKLAPG